MEPDDGVLKRGRTGNDLTTMSEDTRALLMSPGYVPAAYNRLYIRLTYKFYIQMSHIYYTEQVEVNQDPLGVPGRLLRIGDRNSAEVWGKPLADRSFAVVLWFRNQTQAVQHRTSRRLHSGSIERALIHLMCAECCQDE